MAQHLAGPLAALLLAAGCAGVLEPPPAEALLSSPNAQIARSVDAALRRAIPASNSDVRSIQSKLEVRERDHNPMLHGITRLARLQGKQNCSMLDQVGNQARGVPPWQERGCLEKCQGAVGRAAVLLALLPQDRCKRYKLCVIEGRAVQFGGTQK